MTLKLIVGLGNPGPQYAQTRHNAGQWYVQSVADKFAATLSLESKFHGLSGMATIGGQAVRLLLPTTYMNCSGQSVGAIANFYRIAPEEILIAHDELDILPGTLKIKIGGGHGGHNGLKDIQASLANNNNFYRLRIGIGHPGSSDLVTGFVLGRAPSSEQQKIDAAISEAVQETAMLVQGDFQKAQLKLHSIKA